MLGPQRRGAAMPKYLDATRQRCGDSSADEQGCASQTALQCLPTRHARHC